MGIRRRTRHRDSLLLIEHQVRADRLHRDPRTAVPVGEHHFVGVARPRERSAPVDQSRTSRDPIQLERKSDAARRSATAGVVAVGRQACRARTGRPRTARTAPTVARDLITRALRARSARRGSTLFPIGRGTHPPPSSADSRGEGIAGSRRAGPQPMHLRRVDHGSESAGRSPGDPRSRHRGPRSETSHWRRLDRVSPSCPGGGGDPRMPEPPSRRAPRWRTTKGSWKRCCRATSHQQVASARDHFWKIGRYRFGICRTIRPIAVA